MNGHRRHLIATVLFSVIVLAACTGDPPRDETTKSSTSPPTTTSTDPEAQAPRVKNPLDAKAFVAEPCRSVTEFQLGNLGLDNDGVKEPGSDIKHCEFGNRTTQVAIDLEYRIHETNGLSFWYAKQAAEPLYRWEPIEIDGYPAVIYSLYPTDGRECELAVGINDSLRFDLRYTYQGDYQGQDTCADTRRFASAVLTTIKANQ